jgi:hypothetical protein
MHDLSKFPSPQIQKYIKKIEVKNKREGEKNQPE